MNSLVGKDTFPERGHVFRPYVLTKELLIDPVRGRSFKRLKPKFKSFLKVARVIGIIVSA